MGKFFIDVENSTGRYEGVYLDITNFISNCPDAESIDRIPPHRFRDAIQVIMFSIRRRAITSFPACRTQLLEGPPRTPETLECPTLLVTAAIFRSFTNDARHRSLGRCARNRITKIHLFHIATLFRTTYCGGFVGRTESPTSTDQNYLSPWACGLGGEVNTDECFLQGHRDWLRFGLFMSRLCPFRVRGGFAWPCFWVAFGVCFGRSAWRWFRLS